MRITTVILLSLLASITTYASVLMVVSNAVPPGVTWTYQTLFSLPALPVLIICLSTHCIPALSKHYTGRQKHVAWLIWSICISLSVYNYLSYYTNASADDGENRAVRSVLVINSTQQIESVKQSLSRISARPVAEVARALSKSKNEKRIAALNAELEEAKRAEKLQDTLQALLSNAAAIQRSESNEPLLMLLESVTHLSAAVISMAIGAARALAMELLAAFWWYILRSISQPEVKPEISVSHELTALPVSDVFVSPDDDKLAKVKHAIATGQIRQTVRDIREYLRCGQDKAIAIYNLLVHSKPLSGVRGAAI